MKRETAKQKIIKNLVEKEISQRCQTEGLDQAYWVKNLHTGQIIYISPDYELIWGRTRESFYAQPNAFLMSIHPEDRQAVLTANSRIDEIADSLECRMYRPDGQMRWVALRIFLLPEVSGESYRQVYFSQDVTAKKEMLIDVVESKLFLQSTLDALSSHIAILDKNGVIIAVNSAWQNFGLENGLAQENFCIGTNYLKTCDLAAGEWSDEASAVSDAIRRVLRHETSEEKIEYPCHSPEEKRWFVAHITAFNIVERYVVAAHENITIRKLAEEKLRENEWKFRSVIEQSSEGIAIIGQDGKIIEWNQSEERITGVKRENAIGHYLWDVQATTSARKMTSAFIKKNQRMILNLLKTGKALWAGKPLAIEIVKPDGQIAAIQSLVFPIKKDDGFMVCSIDRDITVLKNTERELLENEALLKNIFDNIPSMITIKDAENLRFLKVNQAVEQYVQLSNNQIIGKTAYDLFPGKEADFSSEQDRVVIQKGSILDIPEEKILTKDLHERVLHERKIPMFNKDGSPQFILSIGEDITDQIITVEESRRRLEKLEAVGKLSKVLRTAQSLKDMLPILTDTLLEILHAKIGSIWLYKLEKNELQPLISRGDQESTGILTSVPLKPGEGIPGMVFETGKPYISNEYNQDANVAEPKRGLIKPGLGGVTVPLRTSENVIGAINVSVELPRKITEDDAQLLTTLSEIAGNAIQRTVLIGQTEQRLRQLSALSAIDRAISNSFDMQVSLEILVSSVISQLNMDAANVLLFNPKSQLLEYFTGQGFRTNAIEFTNLRLGESHAGRVAMERKLIQVKNLREPANRLFTAILENENFTTYFGVPLIAKGQLKGVLEVFHRSLFEPDEEWFNFLRALAEQASIAIDNAQMFENLSRSNTELSLAYNATIEGWSRALDLRDKETEGHTQRVTDLTISLARRYELSDIDIRQIRWGALLHDIGKLGVPDGILLKPGALTDEEWMIMRLHPKFAYEMLYPIVYLRGALDIPYCHHEKWDGTGYPRGLMGDQIPLSARIFAVIDVWDALRSDRPYRKAWSQEKVIEHIVALSGSHFDPQVVKTCLNSGIFTDESENY